MESSPTRLCASCETRKTIRGIWYLVPLPGGDAPSFFCESCFVATQRPPPRPIKGFR